MTPEVRARFDSGRELTNKMVFVFARRFYARGITIDDLRGPGLEALWRAAETFDGTGNFEGYANVVVRRALHKEIYQILRTFGPRGQRQFVEKVSITESPDPGEGVQLIASDSEPLDLFLRDKLPEFLSTLTERELRVLNDHYGLELGFAEIGRELNVTREFIRQVHNSAIDKLRVCATTPRPKPAVVAPPAPPPVRKRKPAPDPATERFNAHRNRVERYASRIHQRKGLRVFGISREHVCSFALEALWDTAKRYSPENGDFWLFAKTRVRYAVIDAIRMQSGIKRSDYRHGMRGGDLVELLSDPASHAPSAEALLSEHDDLELIRSSLSSLPEREAFVIRSHYFEGRKFCDLATELGVSAPRVAHLHASGIELLRKLLGVKPLKTAPEPSEPVTAPVLVPDPPHGPTQATCAQCGRALDVVVELSNYPPMYCSELCILSAERKPAA